MAAWMPAGKSTATNFALSRFASALVAMLLVCVVWAALADVALAGSRAATAPTMRIIQAPPRETSSTKAVFRFKGRATTTSCRRDAQRFRRCRGHAKFAGLRPGRHTFAVRARYGGRTVVVRRSWKVVRRPRAAAAAAPFPSRLSASGRSIVDENGHVLPTLRGFNMHVGPSFVWGQSHFDAIAAIGGKINRAVLHWDQFEPSQGVISSAAIANLDLHVARAQSAGVYTLLELHLNVGRVPSWTSSRATEIEKYAAHGQTLTRYLAHRYGDPASPQYTKAVVGFGLNEPPLEDDTIRNGDDAIPYLEAKQRQMLSWVRSSGFAPDWIGFVAYGYASATPIYDDRVQNRDATDASPTAYDSVGGNVVIDVHDYTAGCTNSDPDCSGRQWNGMISPTHQGGLVQTTAGSLSYAGSDVHRSQHAAFLQPYKTFSTQADIPLMLGEWGWTDGNIGERAYIDDKKTAWADAGTVIQINWNYDVSSTNSEWAARGAGTWSSSIANLFTAIT